MRKQTKVVAVASAAALLAIGASMTSFAATGWVEEDGTWYFYDKDGNRVEDAWKKSGDNWYWLDSEEGGAMAADKLVEDDDDTYYVDSNGVMVRNTWVKVVNEEQDDDDDPAEYNYYYMQSNGKAYKAVGTNTRFRTIDGKRYAFDEDGKMLYGWVDGDHNRISDDEWASDGVYYLGSWDDGAMKTGWQRINVPDDEDDDEDKDFWFYFKSNGVKFVNDETLEHEVKEKKINGKKYGFDNRGVMVYEWTIASLASRASSAGWRYFNSIEDGARATKGWFKVVAPDDDNDNTFKDYEETYGTFAAKDASDENERWYYADGDGKLATGEIKKIKGKYYGFRPEGGRSSAMLNGLVFMRVVNGEITDVYDDDVDSDELDDIMNGEIYDTDWPSGIYSDPNVSLYYFGNDEDADGALKTGSVTVNLDGDSYNFYFNKTGGAEGKGKGVNGVDDEKYIYKYGLKLKADADDKYRVVYVENTNTPGKIDIGNLDDTFKIVRLDSADLRNIAGYLGQNRDGDSVSMVGEGDNIWSDKFYLINTSGMISKKKSAARDGADWYFYVNSDRRIVMYTNNKKLTANSDHPDLDQLGYDLSDWDDWTAKSSGAYDPTTDVGYDSDWDKDI